MHPCRHPQGRAGGGKDDVLAPNKLAPFRLPRWLSESDLDAQHPVT